MSSPTRVRKYSRQFQVVDTPEADDSIIHFASKYGISKAEYVRRALAAQLAKDREKEARLKAKLLAN